MKYAALKYKEGEYLYGCINEEGRFEYKVELNDKQFYVISDKEFEIVKTFNIPNLGYNKLKNGGYEIFDAYVQEYDEYEVPVFVNIFNKKTLTKKKILLSIPSEKTVIAAHKLYIKIMEEIFIYENNEEITKLRKKINKGNGIAFVWYEDYPHLEKIFYNVEEIKRLFCYEYENYIVGIKQNDFTKVLKLGVPKKLVAQVIGKNGSNVKEMAKILGVKRIEIISLED